MWVADLDLKLAFIIPSSEGVRREVNSSQASSVATVIYQQHPQEQLCLPSWAWDSLQWTCLSCSLQSIACACSSPPSPDFLFCPLEVWPTLRVIKVAPDIFGLFVLMFPDILTNISNSNNQMGDSYADLIFRAVLTLIISQISRCPFWGTCIYQTRRVGVCQQMLKAGKQFSLKSRRHFKIPLRAHWGNSHSTLSKTTSATKP